MAELQALSILNTHFVWRYRKVTDSVSVQKVQGLGYLHKVVESLLLGKRDITLTQSIEQIAQCPILGELNDYVKVFLVLEMRSQAEYVLMVQHAVNFQLSSDLSLCFLW